MWQAGNGKEYPAQTEVKPFLQVIALLGYKDVKMSVLAVKFAFSRQLELFAAVVYCSSLTFAYAVFGSNAYKKSVSVFDIVV